MLHLYKEKFLELAGQVLMGVGVTFLRFFFCLGFGEGGEEVIWHYKWEGPNGRT